MRVYGTGSALVRLVDNFCVCGECAGVTRAARSAVSPTGAAERDVVSAPTAGAWGTGADVRLSCPGSGAAGGGGTELSDSLSTIQIRVQEMNAPIPSVCTASLR